MSRWILDIETDGLKPTIIWCIVCKNIDTKEEVVLTYPNHDDFQNFLNSNAVSELIGWNSIAYDFPVIQRLLGIDFRAIELTDAMLLSRLDDPSRLGGHSLKNWGMLLKYPKGDHNDWSKLSKEMVEYCKRDVRITAEAFQRLEYRLAPFGRQSIILEHKVQGIISQQVKNGWLFDSATAGALLAELVQRQNEIAEEVRRRFTPLPTFVKEICPKFKKDGQLSSVGISFYDNWETLVAGKFSRVDFPEFNLGSRKQIGKQLIHFGWKPKKFTNTGQPIVDESILLSVKNIPEATLIGEYLLVQKRSALIKSWLDAAESDGRIRGYVNTIGAVTGRMTHSSPNLAQVPANANPYGKECRRCFIAKPGHVLVGADASGLELRMLAHYMKDENYIHEILNGDIHTVNQKAAGLETRDQAKTFIYALLYGAGDGKMGEIIGGSAKKGRSLRVKFLNNLPAFALLRDRVDRATGRGHLRGLDGRKLIVRSERVAINTLLQSAGAVVMKEALVQLDYFAKQHKLSYSFVGNIHDEIQAEVLAKDAKTFGWLMVSCIEAAGNTLGLRCPLTGEYKIGNSWAETH